MGKPLGQGQGLHIFLPVNAFPGTVQQNRVKQDVGHPHFRFPCHGKGVQHPPVDENPIPLLQQDLLVIDTNTHSPLLHIGNFPVIVPMPGIGFPAAAILVQVTGAGKTAVPVLEGFLLGFRNRVPYHIKVVFLIDFHGFSLSLPLYPALLL